MKFDLKGAQILLKKLTEIVPPHGEMRHNITLNGGNIEVTLMIKDKFFHFPLSEEYVRSDVVGLAKNIVASAALENLKS